ncbi:VC0807 family protein [Sphingomonas bacterium]|uniref:VC0807 family protein n=1 Tax=Sphingomonas bacterium TaxID=1895847 RepID=UPI001575D0A0|nr:VC0807 family protein [Sphingomonas bacterium]
MTTAAPTAALRRITGHVAVRALGRSVLINMMAPGLLYAAAAPHFEHGSLIPLALSGVPPMLWLAYSLLKLGAIDFLGLFAIENVIVRMTALVPAHSERDALIGRAMENILLAAMFAASLCLAKPMMFYMSRQLSTGNDPAKRDAFEMAAAAPGALAVYRTLTVAWAGALLIKAAGGYLLATHCTTSQYLIFSPMWDLFSDAVLLTGTVAYAKRHFSAPAGATLLEPS